MCAFGTIEGPVGALRQLITTPYREGDPLWAAGCFTAPYQGLSPVLGNSHAGFSGEGFAARLAPYPTIRHAHHSGAKVGLRAGAQRINAKTLGVLKHSAKTDIKSRVSWSFVTRLM